MLFSKFAGSDITVTIELSRQVRGFRLPLRPIPAPPLPPSSRHRLHFATRKVERNVSLVVRPESLKKTQLVTREVQMASAFAHRLFTRGHVKYVRFHGDRAADRNTGAGFHDDEEAGSGEEASFTVGCLAQHALMPPSRTAPSLSPKKRRGDPAASRRPLPPSTWAGNRRIKERDLDFADLHWGRCTRRGAYFPRDRAIRRDE